MQINYRSLLLFAVATLFISNVSMAQSSFSCSTSEANEKMEKKFPHEVAAARAQLEMETSSYEFQKSGGPASFIIPVVFHVLHEYGSENISREQIMDAMNIMNNDYRKLNADTASIVPAFVGIAADSKIEFRLAQLDPNGNCTDGIDRIYSNLTNYGDDDAKLNLWPRNKYLNIWVVRSISSGAAGYSMYPSSVSGNFGSQVDGIMILSNYVGSIGTGSVSRSRALTHEAGHWMNLSHCWGDTNSPGDAANCSSDDHVTDTPNSIGWTTCNLTGTSCGSTINNVQNYMEYSYCTNMFSAGQCTRMQAALNSSTASRNNLWKAANLTATGVNTPAVCTPIADFTSNTSLACVNSNIIFTDASWNSAVTSWSWSFPGGVPATSTLQSPTVMYANPGTYSATLTSSNGANSNSITKTSAVVISANTADIQTNNFYESFESLTLPATNWMVNNATGGSAWSIFNTAGASGSKSIRLYNYSSDYGAIDDFILPSVDFTQYTSPVFTFKVAYAQLPNSDDADNKLQVQVSQDCGKTWSTRLTKAGTTLATVSPQSAIFTPNNAAQWRQETVVLGSFVNSTNAKIRFRFTAGSGNNIFIDDINISGVSGINDASNDAAAFNIFPNPTDNEASILFNLEKKSNVTLKVIDMLGNVVYTYANNQLPAGDNKLVIDKLQVQAAGIYFVQMQINNTTLSKKLVIK